MKPLFSAKNDRRRVSRAKNSRYGNSTQEKVYNVSAPRRQVTQRTRAKPVQQQRRVREPSRDRRTVSRPAQGQRVRQTSRRPVQQRTRSNVRQAPQARRNPPRQTSRRPVQNRRHVQSKSRHVVREGSGSKDSGSKGSATLHGCGCDGGLVSLTLKYNGVAPQQIKVTEKNNGATLFSGIVTPGHVFVIVGTGTNGHMGPFIEVYYGSATRPNVSIHTSCSETIEAGSVFGDFEVVAGISKQGQELCGGPPGSPPGDCDSSFKDCRGICGGVHRRDCAGNCYNPETQLPPVQTDCEGVCDGSAQLDCKGVCNGNHELDCGGNCYNPRTEDPPVVLDCAGVCDGDSLYDCAGVCNGDAETDCKGICNGNHHLDCKGVCDGDSHMDCKGICEGESLLDCSGFCYDRTSEDPKFIRDCKGVCGGDATHNCSGKCISTDCFDPPPPRAFRPEIRFSNYSVSQPLGPSRGPTRTRKFGAKNQ